MNRTIISSRTALLTIGLALWIAPGALQCQPLYDRVDVNLPYTVNIGDKTLQPGDYTIQQLNSSSGDSRVLLIYSNNGMKFETSSLTIPALDPNTARSTKLVLHHIGNDYYIDKIWIQGKDYGYEFPLPNSVKEREKEQMQPVSVAATYTSAPATQTAQAPPPAPAPAPAETAPPPSNQNTETAQNTPPPQPTPAPAPPPEENNSANRTMPKTSAGWLLMLLSGGALSGAGLWLRGKRY